MSGPRVRVLVSSSWMPDAPRPGAATVTRQWMMSVTLARGTAATGKSLKNGRDEWPVREEGPGVGAHLLRAGAVTRVPSLHVTAPRGCLVAGLI